MRSERFWPGDKVMTLVEYNGIPSGTIGTIASRWMGTGYAVRLQDGTFRWLSSSEFSSTDPSRHNLQVGDVGVMTSDKFHHDFAKVGDLFQVVKVLEDVDYYQVNINKVLYWFGGFQLAPYLPRM